MPLHVRVAAVREQVTAVWANSQDAELLDLTLPQAIMMIDAISFEQSATPVLLAKHRYSTEHFIYVNEVR
ncbi:UTRA domain-containing protein [Tatumella saanichensis]|uniref:UTRA domain-containing protein n=1 Tax=Tatumella saanichensis TaxID=480813 RepID=UPI0004A37EC7|nr:UTRA domain-containing protein [Tatumella saanichensis]